MTGLAFLPEVSHSSVTPSISIRLNESDLGWLPFKIFSTSLHLSCAAAIDLGLKLAILSCESKAAIFANL